MSYQDTTYTQNNMFYQNTGYLQNYNGYCNGIPYDPGAEADIRRSNLRIQEAKEKAVIDVKKQEYLDETRAVRRERLREYREGLYDDLCIENGVVSYVTKNSMFGTTRREVCNLSHPSLARLRSSEDDEGVLKLCFWIGAEEKAVLLQEVKLSNGKYLLARVRSVGGEVYARKESKAEQILGQLLSKLMQKCETEVIPAHEGWNREPDGTFYFVKKGERTWNTVMKMLS